MIKQISVFLENSKGRLASLCRCMADNGINMHTLTVADTSEYGIARIICDDPDKAQTVLAEWGYRAISTQVVAVSVPNVVGGLATLLEALDALNVNIEYSYCFSLGAEQAVNVIKVGDPQEAAQAIIAAGFSLLGPEDLG